MRVLRDNRDSVMAMLEAFVYDPLISWRLLTTQNAPKDGEAGGGNGAAGGPVPLSRSNSLDESDQQRLQKSPVDKMRDLLTPSPLLSALDGHEDEGRHGGLASQSELSHSPMRLPEKTNAAATLREAPLRRSMSNPEVQRPGEDDEPMQENLNARCAAR